MDARAKTVRDILFSGDQYLIPFFQRHYSWKLQHWQRLWDDLRVLADNPRQGQHFLGPLVCTPINHMPGEVPQYQLIDGQQRLTTLTVLLAALRDLAKEHGFAELAEDITDRYLIQKREKGLLRYKLIPRVGDREVLIATLEGNSSDHSRRVGIIRAHRFLKAAAAVYVKEALEKRLRALEAAVTSRLSLVVITVDGENPYEIFESLNSTGLPLEESDLIRNFIFMKVPLADQDHFHRAQWQPFESMFEATEDMDAMDMTSFYRDYLMRGGEYSRRKQTFVDFKEQMRVRGEAAPATIVEELKKYARFEQLLQRRRKASDPLLDSALDRFALLDVTTAHPLMLTLLARHEAHELPTAELVACLADLESFVIRRSICGESTRGYGEMFTAAVKMLGTTPRESLKQFWARRGWPDDETFIDRLQQFALYRRESRKCDLILRQLEAAYGHKEGPSLAELTVEHVLPQTIGEGRSGKTWREALGEDWEPLHAKWLHTLGNLTLTGYNPNLSNRPFDYKKELFAQSNVQLNKYFQKLDIWDVKSIRSRGRDLAKKVAEIWPVPRDITYTPGDRDEGEALINGGVDAKTFRAEYWAEFLKVLSGLLPELKPKDMFDRSWLIFPTLRYGCYYAVAMDPAEACVSVAVGFRGQYGLDNLRVLRQDENAIETGLGQQIEWEEDAKPPEAVLYLDSAQATNRNDWGRQHQWLAQTLKRFVEVMGPRIYTPEDETFNPKKAAAGFWAGFQQHLAKSGSAVTLPPVRRDRCDLSLGKGVSLWIELSAAENWIGGGLLFEGKKTQPLYQRALTNTAAFAVPPASIPYSEEDGDDRYIGCYRLAFLRDKARWLEYFQWLRAMAEKAKAVYDCQGQQGQGGGASA